MTDNEQPTPLSDDAVAFLEANNVNIEGGPSPNEGPKRHVETERFIPDRNMLHTGYAIEFEPREVPSQKGYNDSLAVRLCRLEDGRRLTWWVGNSIEQERLTDAIGQWREAGGNYPFEVQFVRDQPTSRNGRQYNRLTINSTGSNIELPAVPEDQWTEVTEDSE